MKKPRTTEDEIRANQEWLNGGFERHEARVIWIALAVMFAISLGVWYLSTAHVGYWWTVLLAELLGR